MTRALTASVLAISLLAAAGPSGQTPPPIEAFIAAASPRDGEARAALETIAAGWSDGHAAMIVDLARFMRPARRATGADSTDALDFADGEPVLGRPGGEFPAPPPEPASARIRRRLIQFLERQTGRRFGDDLRRWREGMWALPYAPHLVPRVLVRLVRAVPGYAALQMKGRRPRESARPSSDF